MKVNFRNRKIHLNLPKDQVFKGTEHRDSTPHIDPTDKNQKLTSLGNSGLRAASGYMHERIEMDKSK